jgi:hypothetical protein
VLVCKPLDRRGTAVVQSLPSSVCSQVLHKSNLVPKSQNFSTYSVYLLTVFFYPLYYPFSLKLYRNANFKETLALVCFSLIKKMWNCRRCSVNPLKLFTPHNRGLGCAVLRLGYFSERKLFLSFCPRVLLRFPAKHHVSFL